MALTGPKTRIAVLGDLHYEAADDQAFRDARRQILAHRPDAIFQLGDQGGYSHCGTWLSFQEGIDFLSGFGVPFHSLIGNHDLEGLEYSSDQQAVAAWCQAFDREQPYYAADLGEALAICLSSTGFRLNSGCHHEVRLGAEQLTWFKATLARNRSRPTFVFAHAPVLGSGLRVLQNLHLKCPNAWMNHTDRPGELMAIVAGNPQVKLWFSGHDHLGHDYQDSVSQVGSCTSVHTGVIGPVSRDGARHTRLLEFNRQGFALYTIDHKSGGKMLDVEHSYADGASRRVSPVGVADESRHFPPLPYSAEFESLRIEESAFAIHRGMVVEYDVALEAPLGVVAEVEDEDRLEVAGGQLQVVSATRGVRHFRAGSHGRYFHIFNPNPWLLNRLSA